MGEFVSERPPEKGAEHNQKPPFFHSDKFNDVLRKSRKEVSSRYKSSPPPTVLATRRYPSPDISRTATISSISLPKRPHSTERRTPSSAPASPRALPSHTDMKLLSRKAESISQDILWPSTRQSHHIHPLDISILKSPLNVHRKGIETPLRSQQNVTNSHTRQSRECASVSSALPKNKYQTLPCFSQSRPPTLERVNKLLQKFDTRTPSVDVSSSSERFKASAPIMRTQTMPVLGGKIAEEITGQQTKSFTPSLSRWQSPRVRQSHSSNQLNHLGSSSVLGFVDSMRGRKKCLNHLEYVHHLRLLSNRHLQWQFVNAQADSRSGIQKVVSEKILCDVWNTLQPLLDSVENKTTYLRRLKLSFRLKSLLDEQMTCLGDWICHRTDYACALDGATEDIRAVALLPVIGARVENATLEHVLRSAMDLMQAMESRGSLHTMVEGVKCLVRELAEVGSKERVVVEELEDHLASIAYLQIQEQSLGAQLITHALH